MKHISSSGLFVSLFLLLIPHMELFITACHCLWQNWAWCCCRPKDTIKTWVEKKNSTLQQKSVGERSWQRKGDTYAALNLSSSQEIPFSSNHNHQPLTVTNRRAALCACLHFGAVLQSEARLVQLCSLPASSGLFTDSHTLILKHGRAINSVAAALICSLRGDCIRTMPSSGCSREERDEREERRKKKRQITVNIQPVWKWRQRYCSQKITHQRHDVEKRLI